MPSASDHHRSAAWVGAVAAAFVSLWSSLVLASGPTVADPHRPLSLWSDGEAVAAHTEASELYAKTLKAVEGMLEKAKANQFKRISLKAAGQANVDIIHLNRLADQLLAWGEPAGADFRLRADALGEALGKVTSGMQAAYADQLARGYTVLQRSAKQKLNLLPQVKKLLDVGEFAEAEQRLLPVYYQLEMMGMWYPHETQRKETLSPYEDLLNALTLELSGVRTEAARKAIAAELEKIHPDYDKLIAEIDAAAAAVGRDGQAELGGEKLAGPAWVARFGDQWRDVNAASAGALAHAWALATADGDKQATALAAAHGKFQEAVTDKLAALVTADASRATADDARRLYPEYLQALAQLPLGAAQSRLESALETLVNKSPELKAEVAAYRGATSDLLRWRARVAKSQARRAKQGYDKLPDSPIVGSLQGTAAPEIMLTQAKELIGKKIAAVELRGANDGQHAISGFTADWYVRTPLNPKFDEAIDRLKADLMIQPDGQAWTLEAALALASAERGDLAEAGGAIAGAELEGLLPLYTRATGGAMGPVRAEKLLPAGESQGEAFRQVRLQLELQPQWLRHQYFWIELPESAPAGGG